MSLPAALAEPAAPQRLVLVGDSTVSHYAETQANRGWGMYLAERPGEYGRQMRTGTGGGESNRMMSFEDFLDGREEAGVLSPALEIASLPALRSRVVSSGSIRAAVRNSE